MAFNEKEHDVQVRPGHETPDDTHDDSHDETMSHDDHDSSNDDVESTAPRSIMSRQRTARASEDLRGTASNVLSHIASRISTRGWPEPPPPPDGGAKAWTQVACVRHSEFELVLYYNTTSRVMRQCEDSPGQLC